MIARVWHGWTTSENAGPYERLLREEIFPGIAAKGLAGYRSIDLLRREVGREIEFTTIMWFDSLEVIKSFTGEDYEQAYVPPAAREVLTRFDARAMHFEVREHLEYS